MRSIGRKSILRSAILLGAVGAATVGGVQVGCSSPGAMEPGSAAPPEVLGPSSDGTGTVGMRLTLPGGEQVNSVGWTITGPNGAATVVQTGTANVQNSQTVSFQVGGIPAGSGYTISISGQSVDGTVTCAGSGQFSVVARTTVNVAVALQCSTAGSEAGSVLVNGSTFNCGTANSITASPAETTVGGSIAVVGSATGPNPGGLTYSWSAPSGSFDTPTAATANYTCSVAGSVTLTLTVGDGPIPDGGACNPAASRTTVQVSCDGHLDAAQALATATKIKHVVVIFGENISFDHYFGTYPNAQNNAGETAIRAGAGHSDAERPDHAARSDPRLRPGHRRQPAHEQPELHQRGERRPGATNPFRLAARRRRRPTDQGHNYKPEQQASDNGAMDLFPTFTGTAGPPPEPPRRGDDEGPRHGVLRRQHASTRSGTTRRTYAMNDNSWTTMFGPSTPGAINLISGQTNGFAATNKDPTTFSATHVVADGNGGFTLIGDTDPAGRRLLHRRRIRTPSRARTSATCSTPRASAGAGSRVAST